MSEEDGFSLDDLKRAATEAAAEADPADSVVTVPQRQRGFFAPFKQIQLEREEEANRLKRTPSGEVDELELPFEEYCYMCATYTVTEDSHHRQAIKGMMGLLKDMALKRVCNLVAKYHRKHVEPLTGRAWAYYSIMEHITKHVVNPLHILTENIRGIQEHIEAHIENMETIEEGPEGGEEGLSVLSGGDTGRKKKRRKINPKAEESYLKLVKTQMSLLAAYQRASSTESSQQTSASTF